MRYSSQDKPKADRKGTQGGGPPTAKNVVSGVFDAIYALDKRTMPYREFTVLVTDYENDMGGSENLSIAQREYAKMAAALTLMRNAYEARMLSGETIELSEYTVLTNTLRRILMDLGLERKTRDVTPSLDKIINGGVA